MRCTISQIYFDKELYMFQTDLLSIIRSLNTVYTAVGICHASYVDCLLADSCHIPHPTHSSWLYCSNNMWWEVQIIKLLIMY